MKAYDYMRRNGEFDAARRFIDTVKETFNSELVDEMVWQEDALLTVYERKKIFLPHLSGFILA